MSILSFGEVVEGKSYKVLDERQIRGASGIMFLIGLYAFINAFILQKYVVIPYVSAFLMLSFIIGIFVNPKFSPPMFIAYLFVRKQSSLPIGAVQKRFAWSLGLTLATVIFVLSLFLQKDISFFEPVCFLCLICLALLFIETAFGICVGCKLYFLATKMNLIKSTEEKPNCMGDACEVN